MKTLGELEDGILVRLQASTSVAFYTETILDNWIDDAHKWVAGFKPWVVTEGRVNTTFSATEEWSFEGYKPDSFRLVQVGGKRLRKLDFRNYQTFREEEPSSNERVFSDFGGLVFINPNIDASGTLTAWGQYVPANFDKTDKTSTTVFTGNVDEANEVVIEKVLSYAKLREKKLSEATIHEKLSRDKLNEIWQRTLDEQYQYQTHLDSGGMYGRFDVLRGLQEDEVWKRDQFN